MPKKFLKLFLNIASIFTILCIAIMLWYMIQITILHKKWGNVFGYSLFEVITNSMEPTIEVQDDILVKVTDNIKTGDIVVFDDIENNDFIVHRIIKINDNTVITKGDNNNVEDSEIPKDRIIGKVLVIFPKLGKVQEFFRNPLVFIILTDIILISTLRLNFKKAEKDVEDQN